MCGILGFATSKPSPDNVKYLKRILHLSAIRGTDATGIVYPDGNKFVIEKDAIAASDFITKLLPKHEDALAKVGLALGHTRTPTQGTPKENANNHPLEDDKFVLIHNGSVTSMKRLDGYTYKGQVDSEVLLSYITTHGFKEGLPWVGRTGTAAIAVIDKSDPNTVYLWRETNPIKLAWDEASDTLFFASQEDFLIKGLTNKFHFFTTFQIRELPENLLTKISIANGVLEIDPIEYIKVKDTYKHYDTNSRVCGVGMMGGAGASYGDAYSRLYTVSGTSKSSRVDKNTLGLVWNMTSKRWEAEKKVPNNISANNDKIKATLKDMGYDDEQINTMNESSIAKIIVHNVRANKVAAIMGDGSVLLINNKNLDDMAQTMGTTSGLINKAYIKDQSKDFKGWYKLTSPNRGYVSYDGELIKKWDKTLGKHYVMTLQDALLEKLVDDVSLQDDLDDLFGLLIGDTTANDLPKELMQ